MDGVWSRISPCVGRNGKIFYENEQEWSSVPKDVGGIGQEFLWKQVALVIIPPGTGRIKKNPANTFKSHYIFSPQCIGFQSKML